MFFFPDGVTALAGCTSMTDPTKKTEHATVTSVAIACLHRWR